MIINEMFGPTLQGEGKRAGKVCYFIRTNTCNLRCMWKNPDGKTYTKCDTAYTSWNPEKGQILEPKEIVEKILEVKKENNFKDVVITGGEPFLQKDLKELVDLLKSNGFIVTIETNGTIFKDNINADLFSISPKLESSIPPEIFKTEREIHIRNRNYDNSIPKFLDKYRFKLQFKFVYSNENDFERIEEFQNKYNIRNEDIWIMPQGEDVETLIQNHKIAFDATIKGGWNFTSRLHILAYNTERKI